MNDKKVKTKFTIQFNQFDPSHLLVAEILNHQPLRGKARYIVNAVKFYESLNEVTPSIDENCIESLVDKILSFMDKILLDKTKNGITSVAAPIKQEASLKLEPSIKLESFLKQPIGANGLNAVASTLEMFRNR